MIVSIKLHADDGLGGCLKVISENEDYTHCLSKVSTYPEPVHVYIPKKLDRKKPINLNIHFHGHNLAGYDHFDKKHGDYGDFLSKGNSNSVLVIPESKGNCATYDKFFKASEDSFEFIKSSKNLFAPLEVKSLTLSGHSGAYRVLNTLLGHPKLEENIKIPVKGVALFDATYGQTINIEDFALKKLREGSPFLFFDSYVSGKKATAEALSLSLKQKIEKMSLIPDNNIIQANQDCLKNIAISNIDSKLNSLSFPALKYLIDSRFKFAPLPSNAFPENSTVLDLHFGILKAHGLTEFFEDLNSL